MLSSQIVGLSKSSPPDVLKEIKTNGATEDIDDTGANHKPPQDSSISPETRPSKQDLDDSKRSINEQQCYDNKTPIGITHSGSSIELLCDYAKHVNDGEPVLPAIIAGDQESPCIKPSHSVEFETPPKKKLRAEDTKSAGVIHNTNAPEVLMHLMEEVLKSKSEIPLKAVQERCRVLSEQSDAGVSIDDKLRMAVLGSFSFGAEKAKHQVMVGRRAASAPGPLEHLVRAFREFAEDQKIESGISSFDGTYDESSNQLGTPQKKTYSGSSQDSGGITFSRQEDPLANSSSSESSQDNYVKQMKKAQQLLSNQTPACSTPQQLHMTDMGNITKKRANDYGKSLADIKEGNIGNMTTASSGYGSSLQARLAGLESDLNIDQDLGKPYKVEEPEEDSMVSKCPKFLILFFNLLNC